MNKGRILAPAAALAALLWAATTGTAHAYIDPGTGGMLLQLLAGGIAGALVILKLYWHRFKEGFSRLFRRQRSDLPKAPD